MKVCKIFILQIIFVGFLSNIAFSQNQFYVGIAPIGFINKLRLSTEWDFTKRLSLCSINSLYYGQFWKGYRSDINLRIYLSKIQRGKATSGIYIIGQFGLASFKTPYTFEETYQDVFGFSYYISTPHFFIDDRMFGQGYGLGMGFRIISGNLFIDVNFKFQLWYLEDKDIIDVSDPSDPFWTKVYTPFAEDGSNFRSIGPGAIFAPSLIFGLSF